MLNQRETAALLTIGLVAVLMVSASTFRLAYARIIFTPTGGSPTTLSQIQTEENKVLHGVEDKFADDVNGLYNNLHPLKP